ncbi:MAG TPA: NAD-dependent epimerase/dehydratase family protein [Rubrobacteraceae bacterium]|nr:NAD-dependent epimerase/dehydratase family protein [Rubrobacteraceae bacterium]
MTTTMVTGGLGYVGRHLVARLAERGERVVSYNRDYAEGGEENVTYVQGELYDLPRFVDTIGRYEVGRVIHTAAMSHPDLSIDLPITTFTANVDGTVHVFEAARMSGVRRIVNFSSETAYGHVEAEPVTEDAPLHPTTPYGVTKVATELLGQVYSDLYGLDVISLRISEVYGPGNRMPQFLREMINSALQGEPYRLEKGGDHRFQFIRVEDVARAAILAADAERTSRRVYNITGGSQVTLAQAAEIVRGEIREADVEIGPGHLHLDRQGPYDITAAGRDLGYRPEWSVECGIHDYVDWLRDHPY